MHFINHICCRHLSPLLSLGWQAIIGLKLLYVFSQGICGRFLEDIGLVHVEIEQQSHN